MTEQRFNLPEAQTVVDIIRNDILTDENLLGMLEKLEQKGETRISLRDLFQELNALCVEGLKGLVSDSKAGRWDEPGYMKKIRESVEAENNYASGCAPPVLAPKLEP